MSCTAVLPWERKQGDVHGGQRSFLHGNSAAGLGLAVAEREAGLGLAVAEPGMQGKDVWQCGRAGTGGQHCAAESARFKEPASLHQLHLGM